MAKRPPRPCSCSPACDATTARSFAPGHDARMVSRLATMVAAGELPLEEAGRQIHLAGGRRPLLVKLVQRVQRAPVVWSRCTPVSVFAPYDQLVIQYYADRAKRDLPPWVLHRTDDIRESPMDQPEMERAVPISVAFWSVGDAVTWQARHQARRNSRWYIHLPSHGRPEDPDTVIDSWDWLK